MTDSLLFRADRLRARGQEALLSNRPAAAARLLARAIELKPDIPHFHLLYSQTCARLGRRKEAFDHAELALGPGPETMAAAAAWKTELSAWRWKDRGGKTRPKSAGTPPGTSRPRPCPGGGTPCPSDCYPNDMLLKRTGAGGGPAGRGGSPEAAQFRKALLSGYAGKVVKMRREYKRFIALGPPRGIQLLKALIETGRYAEAFKLAAHIEKENESGVFFQLRDPYIDPRFMLPGSYYLGHIKRLLRRQPPEGRQCWKYLWLGSLYWKLNKPEAALLWLDKLEKLCGPADGWKLFLKGFLSLVARNEPLFAAKYFRSSLDSRRGDWIAACYLAEIDICSGHEARGFKRFAAELEKARSLPAQTCADILAWRGEMELIRGRYASAVRDLDAARAGGSVFAYCWLGGALLMLGRAGRAVKMLDQALKIMPDDREALVWQGEALRKTGQFGKARPLLLAARAHLSAAANLVILECDAGRAGAARKYFSALPGRFARRAPRSGPGPSARHMRAAAEKLLRLDRGNRRQCLHQSRILSGRTPGEKGTAGP